MAAFICGYEVRQLSVTAKFTVQDLKDSLKEMYRTAGVKGQDCKLRFLTVQYSLEVDHRHGCQRL